MLRQPLVYDVPTTLTPTEKKKAKEYIQEEMGIKRKQISAEAIEYKQKLIKAATKKNKGAPLTSEQVREIEAKVREFRKQKRDTMKQELDHLLQIVESNMLAAKQEQIVSDTKLAHAAKVEEEMLTTDKNLFPLDPIHMVGKALVAGTSKLKSLMMSNRHQRAATNNKKHTR